MSDINQITETTVKNSVESNNIYGKLLVCFAIYNSQEQDVFTFKLFFFPKKIVTTQVPSNK